MGASAPPVRSSKKSRRYLFLFGLQTLGAVVLFGHVLPLYRYAVAHSAAYEAHDVDVLIWPSAASFLMQVGFWTRYHLHLPFPQFRNALIGYVIWFLSRLSFLLWTAVFGFVFINPRPEFHLPVDRHLLMLAWLFSFFCYTQEVENLAKSLISPAK